MSCHRAIEQRLHSEDHISVLFSCHEVQNFHRGLAVEVFGDFSEKPEERTHSLKFSDDLVVPNDGYDPLYLEAQAEKKLAGAAKCRQGIG